MLEDKDLKNRVVICTGASSGIGHRLARTLALGGASVFLVGRQKENLEKLAAEIETNKNGVGVPFPIDLRENRALEVIHDACCKTLGPPDILVNAAGVNLRERWDLISQESWNETIQVNLSIPFFLAQKCIPGMVDMGWGRIINIASLQSYRAFPNSIAYGASKGGIAQVTRAMAEAWSELGISTNAIVPGFFPTGLTAPVFNDTEKAQHNAKMTAIGRNGQLPDLDGIIIFLASRSSDYITGQIINVDGGYSAK